MASTPSITRFFPSCDQQGFSSIAEYVQCTDNLRVMRGGAPPPVPPKPLHEEVYLLKIDFHDQTTQIALLVTLVLAIHPLMLLMKKWKSWTPNRPGLGIIFGLAVLIPNVFALLYVATNVDLNYLKAHYEHLGHPPLYGDVPPLINILYGWLFTSCFEMLSIGLFLDEKNRFQLTNAYLNVIDCYLCIFYWKNLTCLCRILTGLVVTILTVLFCPFEDSGLVKKIYINSAYYIFNIVHMLVYIWRGVTNHRNPSEVVTTSWFVVPSEYQQFAIYQVCVLVLEWILSFIIYRSYLKQQQQNKKQTTTTKEQEEEESANSKQD